MKVYAQMKNDDYVDLVPDVKYEIDYRIGDEHIVLVSQGNARYMVKCFVFFDENGNPMTRKSMNENTYTKNKSKFRKWVLGR